MREIKFRYRIKQHNDPEIRTIILTLHDLEFNFYEDIIKNNWEVLSKDQFIGLKDKSGKEIYEGDILKCYCPTLIKDGKVDKWYNRKVYFKNGCFRYQESESGDWAMGNYEWQAQKVEIIGNIYENPELLEDNK